MHRGIHPGRIGLRALAQVVGKLSVVVSNVKRPGEAQLAMVAHAQDLLRFAFGRGKRGHEHAGQDGDNCDDNQKLNEREASLARLSFHRWNFWKCR